MKASANLTNIPLPFPYKLYAMLEDSEMLNFEHQEYPVSRAQVSHDQDSQCASVPDYEHTYEPRTIEAMLRDTYGTKQF
jgi:hypothetical protein